MIRVCIRHCSTHFNKNTKTVSAFVSKPLFSSVGIKSIQASFSSPMSKKAKVSTVDPVYQSTDGKVVITILAKPGAKQNAITDISEESIGVQIAAPPVDGKANMELVKFMAKTLGVRKSDVVLERGSKSHSKTVAVTGKSKEDVLGMIRSQIDTDH